MLGEAMEDGEPKLGRLRPPPGVAGEVTECSEDSTEPPTEAGEPPSPSLLMEDPLPLLP